MLVFDKIKDIRETKGLTQEDVADALNLSASGYSKIERGETRLNLERLQQIADVLEVNIFDLIPNRENNFIHEISGGYNNFQGTYHVNDKSQIEIEKLQLTIKYKDQLLAQKDDELNTLKSVLALLQEKLN